MNTFAMGFIVGALVVLLVIIAGVVTGAHMSEEERRIYKEGEQYANEN